MCHWHVVEVIQICEWKLINSVTGLDYVESLCFQDVSDHSFDTLVYFGEQVKHVSSDAQVGYTNMNRLNT